MEGESSLHKGIVFAICVAMILAALFALLLFNRAPLWRAPGPLARLAVYLTQNVAQTQPDATFPELVTPRYQTSATQLFAAAVQAGNELGWQVVQQDAESGVVKWEVITPVLRFTDDVELQIGEPEGVWLSVNIRSQARLGRADFAANARHVQDLNDAIKARLDSQ